jgi:hypothetical protein
MSEGIYMNKNYTLVKNLSTQLESTIVGMDIVSPAITVPYKRLQKSKKTKEST